MVREKEIQGIERERKGNEKRNRGNKQTSKDCLFEVHVIVNGVGSSRIYKALPTNSMISEDSMVLYFFFPF